MFYFLCVPKTQNQQQIAGVQEEGQRARDITLRPPSARNSHLAALRFAQTGAVAAENAEAALLGRGVAQPVLLQAERPSLRPQSARHVQRPHRHPLRHHQIHRFGSFACFTGRLSGQSEPKSLRRTPPRPAHRLQIRRRLPCIRAVALTTKDRKLFDCSPGYGLLTVASSIFPIDGPPRCASSPADLQPNGSLRRNGSLQKAPAPLPRRSALVTRSVVLARWVDRSRRRRASRPPIALCRCIRASRGNPRFSPARKARRRVRKARRRVKRSRRSR